MIDVKNAKRHTNIRYAFFVHNVMIRSKPGWFRSNVLDTIGSKSSKNHGVCKNMENL